MCLGNELCGVYTCTLVPSRRSERTKAFTKQEVFLLDFVGETSTCLRKRQVGLIRLGLYAIPLYSNVAMHHANVTRLIEEAYGCKMLCLTLGGTTVAAWLNQTLIHQSTRMMSHGPSSPIVMRKCSS